VGLVVPVSYQLPTARSSKSVRQAAPPQQGKPKLLSQLTQAAARDPTCIPVMLHIALGARHRLASVMTDPVWYKKQRYNLRTGLFLLNNLTASMGPLCWCSGSGRNPCHTGRPG